MAGLCAHGEGLGISVLVQRPLELVEEVNCLVEDADDITLAELDASRDVPDRVATAPGVGNAEEPSTRPLGKVDSLLLLTNGHTLVSVLCLTAKAGETAREPQVVFTASVLIGCEPGDHLRHLGGIEVVEKSLAVELAEYDTGRGNDLAQRATLTSSAALGHVPQVGEHGPHGGGCLERFLVAFLLRFLYHCRQL